MSFTDLLNLKIQSLRIVLNSNNISFTEIMITSKELIFLAFIFIIVILFTEFNRNHSHNKINQNECGRFGVYHWSIPFSFFLWNIITNNLERDGTFGRPFSYATCDWNCPCCLKLSPN